MKNSTKALLYQLPGMLLIVLATLASFYVKISKTFILSWATPITLLIITVLFFIGLYFQRKGDNIW